jgi:hypothetical protein
MLLESLLREGREDFIAQQMGDKIMQAYQRDQGKRPKVEEPIDIVNHFSQHVPPKMLQWTINQYVKGNIKMEDAPGVGKNLEKFVKNKNQLEKKDINQYKTAGELYATLRAIQDADEPVSKRQMKKQIKSQEAKVHIDTPNFKIIEPLTHKAACYYGANTQWCTTTKDDPSLFDHYSHQGPLYVIIAKKDGKDRKFQLHYHSDQLMDENDSPIGEDDIAFLSQFPEWADFLNQLIDKHYSPHLEDYVKEGFIQFLIRG